MTDNYTTKGRTMAKTKLPTRSQAYLIAFFAGQSFPKVRTNEATYEVCRVNGWIERIDAHPYHQATADGLAALAAYQRANAPAADNEVMELVAAYGVECYHHTPNTANAQRLLDAIRLAVSVKEA